MYMVVLLLTGELYCNVDVALYVKIVPQCFPFKCGNFRVNSYCWNSFVSCTPTACAVFPSKVYWTEGSGFPATPSFIDGFVLYEKL